MAPLSSIMHISYLADRPELAEQLIPGLLEHWRYVFPKHTTADRAAKFQTHQNYDQLPIAWVAHAGDITLGTAALRAHDIDGRNELTPWLGGVFIQPAYRGRGIATALCRTVEAKAHAMGVERLYLFTHGQEALYRHLGWQYQETIMWHGHAGSIMSKIPVPSAKQST